MMEIIISTFFKSLLVVQVLQFLLQCNKLLIYCLGPGREDYFKSLHMAPPTIKNSYHRSKRALSVVKHVNTN